MTSAGVTSGRIAVSLACGTILLPLWLVPLFSSHAGSEVEGLAENVKGVFLAQDVAADVADGAAQVL